MYICIYVCIYVYMYGVFIFQVILTGEDGKGVTGMHVASILGAVGSVEVLIERGAYLDMQVFNRRRKNAPLHCPNCLF